MTKTVDLDSQAFPFAKQLDADRFAYVIPLLGGRARICVSQFDHVYSIDDFF